MSDRLDAPGRRDAGPTAIPLASPCVGLCRIGDPGVFCTGCARSCDEIAGWGTMAEEDRRRVWAALPGRRAALGIGLHRLPWGAAEIRRFVEGRLRPRGGTWVFGVPGALAEFTIEDGEAMARTADADAVTAATARGAVRFAGFERMRALAFGGDVVALVVPSEFAAGAPATLADRGPDGAALDPVRREDRLFDLGLGPSPSRFCVRVADPDLRGQLEAERGAPWRDHLPRLGPALVAASPTRVVVTPAGRAEVYAPIPPPGGASPPGPRTHLHPAALALGHEAPPALGIPAGYAVGALHHPAHPNDEDHHAH